MKIVTGSSLLTSVLENIVSMWANQAVLKMLRCLRMTRGKVARNKFNKRIYIPGDVGRLTKLWFAVKIWKPKVNYLL